MPIARQRVTKHIPATTNMEAGSNTSTVTLRVVGGDEKGSLKYETVIYGREAQGTRTREKLRWPGSAAFKKQTRPLVREGAPETQDRNCQRVINIWSWAPDGARHQDLQIDWPSVAMWLWLWLFLFARQRHGKHAFATTEEAVFLWVRLETSPVVNQKKLVARRMRIEGVQRS
jgi:hypothetical protein